MGNLSNLQFGKFHTALIDAFPLPERMLQLLRIRLDKNMHTISYTGNITNDYFNLLTVAEAEGWTQDLLRACREANPGNAALLAFSQDFELASTRVEQNQLEKIIQRENQFISVVEWRERLGMLEAQVCRVEVTRRKVPTLGTGFLVGPDAVLTVGHILDLENGMNINDLEINFRFDFKVNQTGVVNPGIVYNLAGGKAGLIAYSPYSSADQQGKADDKENEPTDKELDFALLRLARPAGKHPVGNLDDKHGELRGWVRIPGFQIVPRPEDPLLILQHPAGGPLKLALDNNAGTTFNRSQTRMHYTTFTEPGAAGSPCFTSNFELVAMHHARYLPPREGQTKKINQGIPIGLIRAQMERLNLLGVVGK